MTSPSDSRTMRIQPLAKWRNRASDRVLPYGKRTASDYIDMMETGVRDSLTPKQLEAVHMLVTSALPKPAPKIVDLRFGIDLLISRFYVVVFVGKDQRQHRRGYLPSPLTRLGNMIVAMTLLISINVLISLGIFLLAYLAKSAIGIDLFPDSHLSDQMQKF